MFAARSCLALVLCALAACSSGRSRSLRGGSKDGGSSTKGDGGTTGDGGSGSCTACSSDLHSVLDCTGNILTTCPADEGCSPNKGCVAACESAADNRTSIGCEYYVPTPPPYVEGGSCFAAFVANTWGQPITIAVDRAGATLDVDTFGVIPSGGGSTITYAPLVGGMLAPDAVAILFLTGSGCPTTTVGAQNAGFDGTNTGDAFHITTSAPVVSYDIYPYGGGAGATTSATLLEPTSAWDNTFVAVTMPEAFSFGPPWIGFVSQEDGTQVTIKPKVAITGTTTIPGGPAGVPITYTVDKGRFLKIEQDMELTGTTVVSDKPIAVFGGTAITQIPVGQIAGDCMHQQIPPAHSLGNRYAAVRYRNRLPNAGDEAPPWTVVGAVDGTTLVYDPPQLGAPSSIEAGAVIRFNAAGPFVVTSQDNMHPFYFGQHMTGCGVIGGYSSPLGCTGDPEWVNVVPPAQYLSRYVFFTDPTYPITNLVFTRPRDTNGSFGDVTLDCVGTLSGWKPVDSGDQLEYVTVDLINGNFAKQGMCDNGRHVASSSQPFGLTVWGWGSNESTLFSEAVSYGYPAGQSIQLINTAMITIQ